MISVTKAVLPKAKSAYTVCWTWADDWGGVKGAAEPSPSQIIRAIAATGWHGHRRSLACVYNLDMCASMSSFRLTRPGGVKDHGDGSRSGIFPSVEMANAPRARKLVERFQRFSNYMEERRHNWQFVRDDYFADNSIERVEISQLTGETRRRMTLAPGGDACY